MKPNIRRVSLYFDDAAYRASPADERTLRRVQDIMRHHFAYMGDGYQEGRLYNLHISMQAARVSRDDLQAAQLGSDVLSFRFRPVDAKEPSGGLGPVFGQMTEKSLRYDFRLNDIFGDADFMHFHSMVLSADDGSADDAYFEELSRMREYLAIKLQAAMDSEGILCPDQSSGTYRLQECLIDLYGHYRADLFHRTHSRAEHPKNRGPDMA